MLVPGASRPGHIMHRDRYFEAPRTRPTGASLDLHARRKDGSEFPCEISLSAVATDSGMMALAAIRDITDRRRDRDELRRAVRRLQAATDVAIAVGGETDLSRVLEAIVERGRTGRGQALIILLREGDELVVAATAAVPGGLDPEVGKLTFRAQEASEAILLGKFTGVDLGARESGSASSHRFSSGALARRGRRARPGRRAGPLRRRAPAAARGVRGQRGHRRGDGEIDGGGASSEHDRRRRAGARPLGRELHDETLQSLAVLRMRLSSALREESRRRAARDGAGGRPADRRRDRQAAAADHRAAPGVTGHDRSGSRAQALAEQHGRPRACGSVRVRAPHEGEERPPILETAVYRLVQEALNNVSKHSMADHAKLMVRTSGSQIEIEISDDGVGFEPNLVQEGFGLVGMRERAALLGGRLEDRVDQRIGDDRPRTDSAPRAG